MITDNLMSSLREMILAEVRAATAADEADKNAARLHYSRHEAVVREQFAKLGAEAGRGAQIARFHQKLK